MQPVIGLRYHALKLLAHRPHSSAELLRRLTVVCDRRKRAKRAATAAQYADILCADVAAQVVAELQAEGLVNDTEYAEWHVRQRSEYKQRSAAAVKFELRVKGIDDDTTAAAMVDFSDVEQCRKAARKKRKLAADKLLVFLVRKGFPFRLAQQVVAEAVAGTLNEDPGDYGGEDGSGDDTTSGGGARPLA